MRNEDWGQRHGVLNVCWFVWTGDRGVSGKGDGVKVLEGVGAMVGTWALVLEGAPVEP